MSSWAYLLIAIIAEIMATSSLKEFDGFKRLLPGVIVVVGYMTTFYFLSLTIKTIPLGVAYAVWSGVGIVGISLIGWYFYGQKLSLPVLVGMFFILTGVVIVNYYSNIQS